PGDRPDRFDKACAANADAVIVDLEDAVPSAAKAQARRQLASWLSPAHPVFVRINSAGSEWFRDDLELCGRPGVAGIVVPKAEHEQDLAALAQAGATTILPQIESALGLWNAVSLARAPGVQRLVFGAIDFSFDAGIKEGHEQLLYARSQLVLVSRVAGIQAPVDGVTTALDDPERLRDDALRARALGFGGKLCIHPKQVSVVNTAFAPTDAELDWAGRVMAAAAASQGAAVALDGKMVDRPVILIAQQMLEEAGRRGSD
ncbi:MAG: aldolase, partial [Massilia sp.]|nr:aldolase [Massilia sp.]